MDARIFINGETLTGDLALDGAGLAIDGGLETAIAISLFSDRRANADDRLDPGASRRGWWGDAVPPTVDGVPAEGDRLGSRLWLLSREKMVPEVVARARSYAREALQWLIDDGVATRVDVVAEAQAPNRLGLLITVWRPDGASQRFDYAWDAQAQQGNN